jgi:hypothetical protein
MRDSGLFIEMFRPFAHEQGSRTSQQGPGNGATCPQSREIVICLVGQNGIVTLARVFLALLSLVNSTYEMTCEDTSLDAV